MVVLQFAPHMENTYLKMIESGWVTDVVDTISDNFYQSSFSKYDWFTIIFK